MRNITLRGIVCILLCCSIMWGCQSTILHTFASIRQYFANADTTCIPGKDDAMALSVIGVVVVGTRANFDTCVEINGHKAHVVFEDKQKILLLEKMPISGEALVEKINVFSAAGYSVYTFLNAADTEYNAERGIKRDDSKQLEEWFDAK